MAAGGWKLALFLFILCVGNIIAQGIKFAQDKNIIVLTAGCKRGVIGRINVEGDGSGVSYRLQGKTGLLRINDGGRVELLRTLGSTITRQLNKAEFTIRAFKRGTRQRAETRLIIVVLALHFGDEFIDRVSKIQVSTEEGHARRKMSPLSLLHFLRHPTGEAKKIGMAELVWELKIAKIKYLILDGIAKENGGCHNGIQAYFHIRELFSERGMVKMKKESLCQERKSVDKSDCKGDDRFRTFDGTCNNLQKPTLGAADIAFLRLLPAKYFDADNLNDPIGYPNQPDAPEVPSPHKVSNDFIIDEIAKASSSQTLTHAVMQFGQFIDHDLDLATEVETKREECESVPCDGSKLDFVCPCYPILPADGAKCIRLIRSVAICQERGYPKQRQQINVNTAYVDASQVYGSDEELAKRLRDIDNSALLKSTCGNDGELLPLNPDELEGPLGLCRDVGGCFISGDVRTNEQMSLAGFHTLFLREHNRIARFLQKLNRHWSNTKVYLETRRILAAVMQKITYIDFLPKLLGPNGLKRYRGYNQNVNPGISNVFATAAFRFGHSLIRPSFDILDKNFNPIGPPIDLRFMFFNNTFIQRSGITPLLLGLVGNSSENVDRILSPGIIRHLFQRENREGLNLATLNIQRSRDHGLPGYNAYRNLFKIGNAKTFDQTANEIKNSENRKILSRLYNNDPSNLEVWVAGLAEAPLPNAILGRIFSSIIGEQFQRTRDGDRFYFERKGVFRPDRLAEIRRSSLSRMYCDNLKNVVSIQPDAFLTPTAKSPRITCERICSIDLCKWRETKYSTKPCIYGTLGTTGGICKCKCNPKRRSFGPKCDARPATGPVLWHGSILNRIKQVVCSGARIGQSHVLTTTACANRVRHGGFVRLVVRRGRSRHRRVFSITARSRNGPLTLLRIRTFHRSSGIIQIGSGVLEARTSILTVWGTSSSAIDVVRLTTGKQALCQEVWSPFNAKENACTLPAALPETRRRQGGLLVQYHRPRHLLKALLTDIQCGADLPGDSFGKYITVTRPEVKRWLRKFIRNV